MDISRRSDYACRILCAAYEAKNTYRAMKDVAEELDIPYAFARSIQHDLAKAGILKTERGPRGGFMLDCDPKETTIYDVFVALDGCVSVARCSADKNFCENSSNCSFNKVWQGADKLLANYFSQITLDNLFKKKGDVAVVRKAMKLETA